MYKIEEIIKRLRLLHGGLLKVSAWCPSGINCNEYTRLGSANSLPLLSEKLNCKEHS